MKRLMLINVVAAIAALVLPIGLGSFGLQQAMLRGLAADLSTPQEASIHAFGISNPTCVSWTDSCRTCARGTDNSDVTCSNIGIACQPQAITCTRRAESKPVEAPKQEGAPK